MAMHENCADCVEYYHTCRTWPASKPFACTDFHKLPDVLPGTTGQKIPASRMNGRTEPRTRRETTPDHQEPAPASAPAPARKPRPTIPNHTPSPAATPGPDGARFCICGVKLAKRRRCCDECRRKRRLETMSRHNDQKRHLRASHVVSGVPVAQSTCALNGPGSPGHS
jgi:hypothetical protein